MEPAAEISPYLATDIGPTLAESEILAQIGTCLPIDHTFEQGKTVWASSKGVARVLAEELQRSVVRMFAHSFENVTPDHQEAGARVANAGESVDDRDIVGIVNLKHVIE